MTGSFIVPRRSWPDRFIAGTCPSNQQSRVSSAERYPPPNAGKRYTARGKPATLSSRIASHASLPAIIDRTDFFSQAFYTIARAIAEAGVNVDLFKTPETIAKSVNRRVRGGAEAAGCAAPLSDLSGGAADGAGAADAAHRQLLSRTQIGSYYHEPKK